METKNREKLLLIIVGACIGLYILNVVVISPISAAWSARRQKIANLRGQISHGKDLERMASLIETHWDRMKTNTLDPNPTVAEDQLFRAFDLWARRSGVVLGTQKPQTKDSDDPEYSNMEWGAEITGSDLQIYNFLLSLATSPMGLCVDSIQMTSRETTARGGGGPQLAMSLTVSGLILNTSTNE